jgi:hypothetical protein
MKKYTFFAAALATLVFVGCSKENNNTLVPDENGMVTLTVSGEKSAATDNDKQGFYGIGDHVFFQTGDQMYVNGGLADLFLRMDGPDSIYSGPTHSDAANIRVSAEYIGYPAVAFYPSNLFTPGTAMTVGDPINPVSDWTVSMKQNMTMIHTTTIPDYLVGLGPETMFPNWTLSGYVQTLGDTPRIQLKNNIALLTPNARYGARFVNTLNNAFQLGLPVYGANDALPQLKVTEIQIVSTTNKLYGNGHLVNVNTQEPYLVMDDQVAGADTLFCAAESYDGTTTTPGVEVIPGNYMGTPLGHITVAPFANDGTEYLQAIAYFTLTTADGQSFDFVYTGTNVNIRPVTESNGQLSIRRNIRTKLWFNFWDDSAINDGKITRQ